MRTMIFCLALAALLSELPSVAQTSPMPGTPATQHNLSAAEISKILSGVHGGGGPLPRTPEQKALQDAKMDKINDLDQAGTLALRNRNFAVAEDDYRQLIQTTLTPQMAPQTMLGPAPYYGLGGSLAGQGKTAEAIAAYKLGIYYPLNFTPEAVAASQAIDNKPNLRGCCDGTDAIAWMKYALLLSQTGQDAEALSVYIQAWPFARDTNNPKIMFLSNVGSPSAFQAAVHIALGLFANGMYNDHEQAMNEFDQALRLQPDAAVTNFYYGYGWQRLDLKSKTRATDAAQAKTALTKAAVSEDGNVKKAATEALKGAG